MLPASFDYIAPDSVQGAVEALSASPNARFAAGSVHLLIDLKMRRVSLSKLVDLRKITALYGISADDSGLKIGAMTTLREIMDNTVIVGRYTALAEAAELSGDAQMRNMEAIGGELSYAAPTSDVAAALIALDATVQVTGLQGSRSIPAASFYTGDRTTALAHDEIITSVTLPKTPSASAYAHFRHPAHLGAVCGVAVAVSKAADGTVEQVRIGVTGATVHAFRLTSVEDALTGAALNSETIAQAVTKAGAERAYLHDLQFSGEYRAHLIGVLTKRALSLLV